MNENTNRESANKYTVSTPVFEGPLDLLLHLIERTELDITTLALAQVTDQYLDYMHSMPEQNIEEASAFLIIAAKLIQIKSEVILPRPPVREPGEEDPGEALVQQLKIYKQFKDTANFLAERQTSHTFLRLVPPPKVEGRIDLTGITIMDLDQAARIILTYSDSRPELGTVVKPPPVTIRQKIQLIGQFLLRGATTFRILLRNTRTRLEVVVTFLAMLELIKRHKIYAKQEFVFGEIELVPNQEWDLDEEFELEFGE